MLFFTGEDVISPVTTLDFFLECFFPTLIRRNQQFLLFVLPTPSVFSLLVAKCNL